MKKYNLVKMEHKICQTELWVFPLHILWILGIYTFLIVMDTEMLIFVLIDTVQNNSINQNLLCYPRWKKLMFYKTQKFQDQISCH